MANSYKLYKDDNRNVLPTLPENSIDTIITDPPYGLGKEPDIIEVLTHWLNEKEYVASGGGFMSAPWDSFVPGPEYWRQAYHVLKPGGYALVFGGTRTHDLVMIALRMAGFQIVDVIMWVYGSGRPAGMNISKAIDKSRGAKREVVGVAKGAGMSVNGVGKGTIRDDNWTPQSRDLPITVAATDLAQEFDDYHTRIKPAWEPVIIAMKPLDGNYMENAEKWNLAGFNVGGCRKERKPIVVKIGRSGGDTNNTYGGFSEWDGTYKTVVEGSFPCNLVHDGSDEVLSLFPHTKSGSVKGKFVGDHSANVYGEFANNVINPETVYADEGSAARFFYSAKASPSGRDLHCQHLYWRRDKLSRVGYTRITKDEYDALPERERMVGNIHSTVKPLALMQWLVRITKPPHGGVVLDQFLGSGRTAMACAREGRDFIGVEMEDEYFEIAETATAAEYAINAQRLF